MTNIQKYLVGTLLVLALGLGLIGSTKPGQKALGDSLTSVIATHYLNGINVGSNDQFKVDGSGNVTTTGSIAQTGSQTITGNETIVGSQIAQQLLLNFGLGSTTTPSTTLSSVSGASVGSPIVASGHIVVEAGQTYASASTTAVDANSDVQVQLEQTTPIAGVTCNTTFSASSTDAVLISASTTAPSLNGFQLKVANTPLTNPFCYSFSITN